MKTMLKNGDLANGAMACGVTISIGEVSLLIYYLVSNSVKNYSTLIYLVYRDF